MSRVGCLFLGGNGKGYEVAEHVATKIDVNPEGKHKPRRVFETSMVGIYGNYP